MEYDSNGIGLRKLAESCKHLIPLGWLPFIRWLSFGWKLALVFVSSYPALNTLRPRQNGDHFPDDIFKWIFLNENAWTSIKISLNFIPRSPLDNIPALVRMMAWCRPGDKPLSEPMMVSLLTHICVTRPRWVKRIDVTKPSRLRPYPSGTTSRSDRCSTSHTIYIHQTSRTNVNVIIDIMWVW